MSLNTLLDATWPAASTRRIDGVTLREGRGGGNRVSAATAPGPVGVETLGRIEEAQRALGQVPLWRVGAAQTDLDEVLAAEGYARADETRLMQAPTDRIAHQELGLMTAFRVADPLAAQREIWADGGIDPARLAVMARATGPKTTVLGRLGNHPAGAGFAAAHEGTAMAHALEVLPRFRRKGLGRNMMIALARWAEEVGCAHLCLLVTTANAPARALYTAMGFEEAPGYHYRIQEETP